MGKSSLMVRTAAKLRGDNVTVGVLDLTAFGQNLTVEQWYNGLSEKLGQQLTLEDEIEQASARWEHLGPFQRWVCTLREIVLGKHRGEVVIFVDEIDSVRSLPFSTDEFFAGIRELYNRRSEESDLQRLTFCLLGVATPSDLIRNIRTTPFNIGRRIELTDFTEDEATPLRRGMGYKDNGHELLKRVLYWTGGHPYLTQRLCQSVAEDDRVENKKGVDGVCRDLFLTRRARQTDDNLLFVRERMLRSEVDTANLLTLYAKIRAEKKVRDDETNPLVSVLRLSGITKVDDGLIKIRNRVYYEVFDDRWIIASLPGAELRRQRAAYKRGLKRALILFIPIFVIIVGVAWWYLYERALSINVSINLPQPTVPVFWRSAYMRGSQQPQLGALLVRTGLQNVVVFINNQEYGRTNKTGDLRIAGLPPAVYKIRTEKPGFQAITQEATIIQNSEAQLTFKLQVQTVAGQIEVKGAPAGTSIHLDGRYFGTTESTESFLFSAAPGEHTVELANQGYLPKQTTGRLQLGKLFVIDGSLEIDAEAQEWGALASSQDLGRLQSFVQHFPNGRFSEQARRRLEQLEWNSIKDRDDIQTLDLFLQRFPHSRFENIAREKIAELLREQSDWYEAHTSKDPGVLQTFVTKYPRGPHARQAKDEIIQLTDQRAVLSALTIYKEAYDSRDISRLSDVWPSMPASVKKATQEKFSEAESVNLVLQLDEGRPKIQGDRATLRGKKILNWVKKDHSTSNEEYPFEFEMVREGTHWIILKGQ
jgi:hypothetical protein